MNYNDVFLDNNGDIAIIGSDIMFVNNLIQALKIRLRWIKNEWKFKKEYGIDYIEILGKKSNKEMIESAIYVEIGKIPEIAEVNNVVAIGDGIGVTISFSATLVDGTTISDSVVVGG